jgi:hypothetical protein
VGQKRHYRADQVDETPAEAANLTSYLSGDTLHGVVFQIARFITESTVKVHMKAILRKLRLQNRTQAAIWARTYLGEPYSPDSARVCR